MSIDADDIVEGAHQGVGQLLARAAAAEARASARMAAAVSQLAEPADLWIDDRTRAEVANALSAMIAALDGEIRAHAVRVLTVQGEAALADRLAHPSGDVEALLLRSGVLGDPELVAELLARTMQDMIGEALPAQAPSGDEGASLIVRLATAPDGIVANAANAYLAAEGRRRAPVEGNAPVRTDLPAELHHRLVWAVVAAIAALSSGLTPTTQAVLDRVLTDAALRSLAAHDESDRVEAAAVQLAAAIDATPAELADLATETLRDRRLPLFIAVIAHALGIDYDLAREMVIDPVADRLWIAARALGLPRDAIARIGLVLCEADPRRDLDGFADHLDTIGAIDPADARLAMVPLKRHPDFRAAARALVRGKAA
ncbi:DUF2336 domain-containing protein [Sphingomonas sp. GlSt437]|uniref:DUF2336 domain-containing protein n=1 Tax=Sphingomonas sp. GlSt437 TaxID=3389970 RepID=UPI003A89B845